MNFFEAIRDRIARIFRRKDANSQTTAVDVQNTLVYNTERFEAERDRLTVIDTARKMYDTDTRAKRVIQTLARDMVRGGFVVRSDNQEAVDVANALVHRIGLQKLLDDWTRLALRDGDTFLEVVVNSDLEISSVSRKPTLLMNRNSNLNDQFDNPKRAYWLSDMTFSVISPTIVAPPDNVIWFAEWQIIQARWDHDSGNRYGNPLFKSAIAAWKRITAGETDMAIRRKTRAGQKFVHHFPAGTDASIIEEYKYRNRDVLSNPTAAIADFFGTVDIKAIQGDARLSDIADILHHIRTFFLASPIPMSLLGYGQDLNRDVLEEQTEQYIESLDELTEWVEFELVRPLLERQWLLAGIWPPGLDYKIVWQSKRVIDAQAVRDIADAAVRLRAVGISSQVVNEILTKFLPGIDVGAADDIGESVAEWATPGRIARTARDLRGDVDAA